MRKPSWYLSTNHQDTTPHGDERFLPAFLDGHTTSKARTEVVLMLQVQKV
jgi:hypothetical protein